MNLDRTIIFCQAPADIPYVLTLYEQCKETNTVSIFVINVEGTFRFLSELRLDLEQLVFIPYQSIILKQVASLFAERKRINYLWETHFSNIHSGNVYFFSRFEDWLTAAFLHRFAKNKKIKITYIDHYDDSANLYPQQNSVTLRIRIHLLILKFLTKVNFKAKIKEQFPEFPVNKYAILKTKIELDKGLFLKYAYKIAIPNEKTSNLLFFISPCNNIAFNSDYYYDTLTTIIDILKGIGFKIIIKGHPRAGTPIRISRIADFEIPSYVPGEFIDTNNLKICLGIETFAICNFAKYKILPTYSLIKLIPYTNITMINVYIQYLQQHSDKELLFLNNLEELKKIAFTHL